MNVYRFAACGAMLTIVAIGCGPSGPSLAPVSGTVTYRGTPVSGASVTFVSAENPSAVASGTTDSQGKFSLQTGGSEGAPIGKNNVGIAKGSERSGGPMSAEEAKKMTLQTPDLSKMKAAKGKSELPQRYASPGGSGLSQTVEAGKPNEFTFDLKD